MLPHSHEYFMYHALREAQNAFDAEEVPVGAVVVVNNKIIARAFNQVEMLKDPTAHAEILAITSACQFIGRQIFTRCYFVCNGRTLPHVLRRFVLE